MQFKSVPLANEKTENKLQLPFLSQQISSDARGEPHHGITADLKDLRLPRQQQFVQGSSEKQ